MAPTTKEIIPINALFGKGIRPNPSCDPRPALEEAEVIFAVDVMSGIEFLVFGRATLDSVFRAGNARSLKVLYIGLDQETPELEKLCALVEVVRGHHDYLAGE